MALENDPLNPQPQVWPSCSKCDTPWVLRRVWTFGNGHTWIWQRDCNHRAAEAVVGHIGAPRLIQQDPDRYPHPDPEQ